MKTLVEYLNESLDKNVQQAIEYAVKYGYIEQKEGNKTVKYGISRENLFNICDYDDRMSKEEVEKYIADLEKKGIKFKFETNDEWKKAGYKDPDED